MADDWKTLPWRKFLGVVLFLVLCWLCRLIQPSNGQRLHRGFGSLAMKTSKFLGVLLLLLLCLPVLLNAQVANANMNVAVHDSSGAVVPGAAVKLTNNQTGLV